MPMSYWYDKQGKKLVTASMNSPDWKKQMQNVDDMLRDADYKIIQQDFTPKKKYWISTVWLGLDMSFSSDPNHTPVIFETMVFSGRKDSWFKVDGKKVYTRKDHEQLRYTTEEDALEGHKQMLSKYSRKEK